MKESSKRGAYKGMTDARRRAVQKYRETTGAQINLLLPREEKQVIKDHAAAAGESMNAYILRAVRDRMGQQDANEKAP